MSGHPDQPRETGPKTDPRLLEWLVCPVARTRLVYDRERNELVSPVARLAFPIEAGVPILSQEAARILDDNDPVLRRRE